MATNVSDVTGLQQRNHPYNIPHLVEKIKGFPVKANSFRNTATFKKLRGGVPSNHPTLTPLKKFQRHHGKKNGSRTKPVGGIIGVFCLTGQERIEEIGEKDQLYILNATGKTSLLTNVREQRFSEQ